MTSTAPATVDATTTQAIPEGRNAAAVWAAFLPRLLARIALLAVGGMLFWAVLPVLFGWHATTVMSDSMSPRLWRGDIIVSLPISGDDVRVGQVALFDDPDHAGRLRMHRVIAVSPAHVLTTKGDANASADSTPVEPSAVHGVAVLRIPYLAYPIVWLRAGELVPLALVGAAAAAAIGLALPASAAPAHRATPRGAESTSRTRRRRHSHSHSHSHSRLGTRAGRAARALALVALLAGAGAGVAAAVATPSHSSFSSADSARTSALSAASAFPCLSAPPATSAYSYYRFGETAGTSVADASGNGHAATAHGGVTHVPGSCAPGSAPAVTLDGSTGYLSTPALQAAPNTFTVSLWFKTTSTSGGKLIGFGTAQTGASVLYDRHIYLSNDGRLNFGVYPGLASYEVLTSPEAYNDGSWHQVTATLSSAGMRLYVDGVSVAKDSSVVSGEAMLGYWRIGYDNVSGWPGAPASAYFAGNLSDVGIYSAALSPAQVASSFAAGR